MAIDTHAGLEFVGPLTLVEIPWYATLCLAGSWSVLLGGIVWRVQNITVAER